MNKSSIIPRPLFRVDAIFFTRRFECGAKFSFPALPNAPCAAADTDNDPLQACALLTADGSDILLNTVHGSFRLSQNCAFLCPVSELKTCQSAGMCSALLTLVPFSCTPRPNTFTYRAIPLSAEMQRLIQRLPDEISSASQTKAHENNAPFPEMTPADCARLAGLHLEELLIRLSLWVKSPPQAANNDLQELPQLLHYLETHLDTSLSIEKICRDNLIGRSQLTKLFHSAYGCGVISFFSHLKIQAAQKMIRAGRLNFSQIADALGYTSVQYFSRRFRQSTGMTPSQYARSARKVPAMHPPGPH